MFGYVRADTAELRVRENEYYRALYCGLCKTQGKCTGQCSRFTLSYDVTFLAIVRMAVAGVSPKFKQGTCIAHPLKKRNFALLNAELEYCAYAASILAYGKCLDDIADEKGKKKLLASVARIFLSGGRRRALKAKKSRLDEGYITENIRSLDAFVREKLSELSDFEEHSNVASVDIPADIFGDIMERIASFGFTGSREKIMKKIGRHLGRWVYIVDAADDMAEDKEKGRFNPFLNIYEGNLPTSKQKELIADALKVELCEAEMAFDLIEHHSLDMKEIINNIIYLGMPKSADKALMIGEFCQCDKKEK